MDVTYPILQINQDRTYNMYDSEIDILRTLEDWEDQSEGIWLINHEGYFLDGIVSMVDQKVELRRSEIRFDQVFVREQFERIRQLWNR